MYTKKNTRMSYKSNRRPTYKKSSGYSNFNLEPKKKSKQLPDTTLDNKEFCSYRKI